MTGGNEDGAENSNPRDDLDAINVISDNDEEDISDQPNFVLESRVQELFDVSQVGHILHVEKLLLLRIYFICNIHI